MFSPQPLICAENFLHTLPLFATLTAEEGQRMAALCHCIALPKGTPLFREGDHAKGMHMVLRGLIKMWRGTRDGKDIVLHLIRPGHSVGEGSIFKGGQDPAYPASAAAVEDSEVLFIPADILQELVRTNGDFALAMLSTLATRLYMFTRKLEAHSMREAPQRLAAYLLHRRRMGTTGDCIQLDVSREVLAAMLGTARETLSRSLSRLTERGAITVNRRQIQLRDTELLQNIANGEAL